PVSDTGSEIDDLGALLVGRIVRAEYVVRPLAGLPGRHGGLALRPGDEPRALDEAVVVDVARAIRKDLRRLDAPEELRLRVFGEQRVVVRVRGDAVQPQPLALLEVDEQQADVRVDDRVAG